MSNFFLNSSIASSPGTTELSGLTDVTITVPINGEILIWNAASDEWANSKIGSQPGVEIDMGTFVGTDITFIDAGSFV